MKKWIAIFLILTTILGMTACGNSTDAIETTVDAVTAENEAAAGEVIKLINAIGNVTVNSGEKIKAARNAFDALNGSAQGMVSNLDVLIAAEKTYIEAKAAEIDALIVKIGEVTLDKESAIKAAEEAFNAADADVQLAVKEKATLDAAKAAFNGLKAAEVEALINAIGKVSLKSESKISAAEEAYAALSSEAAALVSNKKTLDDAKTKYEELNRDKVLKALKKKTDKVQGITWYHHSVEPKYANSRSTILPYIGVQNNSAWLRWRLHYTGDNWVFFTKIIILVDGEKTTKVFSYYEVERDNAYGDVWEYVDIQPTDADIELMRKIANSKETIVRFQGDTYHKDITIKDKDKDAINDVLDAYEYLKK